MEIIIENGIISPAEQQYYIEQIIQKHPYLDVERVVLSVDGDFINVYVEPQKRILTKMGGSLISDPITWNDAKRAEYFETVPNPL